MKYFFFKDANAYLEKKIPAQPCKDNYCSSEWNEEPNQGNNWTGNQ